jgi:hypothetical protein
VKEIIDWNKPVQTVAGVKIRILCTDAPVAEWCVIGIDRQTGVAHNWNLNGEHCDPDLGCVLNLINTPPIPRYFININNDGTHETADEEIFDESKVIVQFSVDVENKKVSVQSFGDTKVSLFGQGVEVNETNIMKAAVIKDDGNLMGAYIKSQSNGRSSSIDLNSLEMIDGGASE